MYTLENTPNGKFEVLDPPPNRNWRTCSVKEVLEALEYSTNKDYNYDLMIRQHYDSNGTIRLGDSYFRFRKF